MSRTARRRLPALMGVVGLALTTSAFVAPVAATADTTQQPLFSTYTAPGALGRDAGEPSIGVNWNTGNIMFQNVLETLRVSFDDTVFPATATYTDVSFLTTGVTTLDPFSITDPVTGRTTVSQLLPPDDVAAYTDDDGETWIPTGAAALGANFDHQTYGVGKAVTAIPAPLVGDVVYPLDRITYYCSQLIAEASCGVSRDGGNTFAYSAPVYTLNDPLANPTLPGCAGLHGHLSVGPTGVAYLPNFSCSDAIGDPPGPAVNVSRADGVVGSWSIEKIPDGSSGNFDSDPAVSIDAGGLAYVAYENATSNMMLATYDEATDTWTPSVDIGAAMGIQNATFPDVIAGSEGRAAVAFLGTPAEAPLNNLGKPENQLLSFDPDGDDPTAGWHAYVAMTYDSGVTWTLTDTTPTDPVQRGCIWWGSAEGNSTAAQECADNKRNLLDFNGLAVDKFGRVVFGYADGCVGRCVTEGHTRNTNLLRNQAPAQDRGANAAEFNELYSQEDVGTIARQSCGMGLFAEFDADPAGPLATCAVANGDGPAAVIPEVPFVPALALVGVGLLGGAVLMDRRRRVTA